MKPFAIVVPVMGRPWAASGFMATLTMSTPDVPRVYAIADDDDHKVIQAWDRCGADVVISEYGSSFANKVQFAYDRLQGDYRWLMLVGDDVEFHADWFDEVAVLMKKRSVNLIATNDLHNPFVVTGQHATHPVIRTRWVAEHGASWDGPGSIVHQGYHHAYVDAEWTQVAQDDGCFAFADSAKVEHLHPTWTGRLTDRVYRLGMAHYETDRLLFEQRREQFG